MTVQVGNSACRTGVLALIALGATVLSGCFFVDDDRAVGGGCDAIVTECWDVCDTYCDPWGCWDECFTECEDTCVQYDYAPVTVVDDRSCFADRDCPIGYACDDYVCVPPPEEPGALLCEPCLGHSDCREADALCIQLESGADTGFCGSACSDDRDCPSNYECVTASNTQQCVPVDRVCDGRTPVAECDRDNECATDEICEGGLCIDAPTAECATDRDCPEPEICVAGACEPFGSCVDDRDCPEGETCAEGLCERLTSGCERDRDCTEGQACVDGACVDPSFECATDRDCDDGDVCIDAECVTPAERDACTFSYECDDGFCIDGLCRTECADDSSCAADEQCRGGVCSPRPEPECRTGADCGEGDFLCVDGRCRDICQRNADCGFGYVCTAGYCGDDPDVECRDDLECGADQRCVEGACFYTCRASCNCPNGLTCDADTGLCESRPAPDSCESECDCPSGMACESGECVER